MKGKVLRELGAYLLVSAAVLCVSPLFGSEAIEAGAIADFVLRGIESIDSSIFFDQRVPRVLFGFLCGGSLAIVGSVFQVILRNPLATPYTLGVTGGAAVGAFSAIAIGSVVVSVGPFSSVQIFGLAGAFGILGIIYLIARRRGGISMNTLLLAGVTLGITCSAFILLIRYVSSPDLLVSMDRWMMGRLDIIGYGDFFSVLPLVLPGLVILFFQMRSLNHLSMGEDMAKGFGVDVSAVQKLSFLGGSLVTAGVVSMAGPIGFIGLIVPHIVRRISGFDNRIVMPSAFLAGGSFLVICDTAARTVISPTEMPVGIITAMVGGPFFIYLLVKSSERNGI